MKTMRAAFASLGLMAIVLSFAGCPQGASNSQSLDENLPAVDDTPAANANDQTAPADNGELTTSTDTGSTQAGDQAGDSSHNTTANTNQPGNNAKTPIQGDIDGDGLITTNDLALAQASFGLNGQAPAAADINGNGVIDLYDLAWMLAILSR